MRALMLSTLVLAGCGGAARPPVAPAAPRVVAATSVAPDLADPLALLPADADLIVTIDVAALRASTLFATYGGMVRGLLVPGFAACAYDPRSTIRQVTPGFPMSVALGVFVVRGLDQQRTLDCLKTSTIDTKTEVDFDGEFVALRNKSGNTNMMTFVDAHTAVFQGSKGPTRDTLTRALQVGAPLRQDQALVATHAARPRGAVISMVGRPGSSALSEMLAGKVGAPSRGLAISVHVTDVISAHVALEMVEAADAAAIAEAMEPKLAGLRQFVERYDVHAEGPALILDFTITEAQIKTFAALVQGLVGASATP